MKRRTRLIFIGCATLSGTFLTTAAAQAASAATSDQTQITVQAGDTLWGIGVAHGVTWEALAAFNQIPDPNLIFVGQVVKIPPAGYVPATSVASAPVSDPAPAPVTVSAPAPDPAPAPAPAPAPTPAPVTVSSAGSDPSGVWGCIAQHESGGDPSTNTGNGYYGMYQDTEQSWVAAGGLAYAARPDLASAAAQTTVNQTIQAQQGWGAWPVSSAACGV